MAPPENGSAVSPARSGAYEPEEDWLGEWLAVVEDEIAGRPGGASPPAPRGATLVEGTDIGALQSEWLLHGTLPELRRGPRRGG